MKGMEVERTSCVGIEGIEARVQLQIGPAFVGCTLWRFHDYIKLVRGILKPVVEEIDCSDSVCKEADRPSK